MLPLVDLPGEKVLCLLKSPPSFERVPPDRLLTEDVRELVQVVPSP